MGTRTLCCVALCVLVAKHTDAGVIQTPRHKVTEVGQAVTLECEPISSHNTLFWYKQTLVQELELLTYFRSQSQVEDAGLPKGRFSAKMLNSSFSTLNIQPSEPRDSDSGVYFCASSLDTGLQKRALPVQNRSLLSSPLNPQQCQTEAFPGTSSPGERKRERTRINIRNTRVFQKYFGWGYLQFGGFLGLLTQNSIYAFLFKCTLL
uniref:Ig-like domain-containing protein n=1 Tax=Prolemur simus TaxID=1328070 RepID=A0A8C9DCW4_PROSS